MGGEQSETDTWDRSTVFELSLAAGGAYLLTYVAYYLLLGDIETMRGLGAGETAELYQLASLMGIHVELSMGIVADEGNFAAIEPMFLVMGAILAGVPLIIAAYFFTKRRLAVGSSGWTTFGLAITVPYALVVGWRASAFGPVSFRTVSEGSAVAASPSGSSSTTVTSSADWTATGKPGTAILVACVLSICCGLLGAKLAHWRHG